MEIDLSFINNLKNDDLNKYKKTYKKIISHTLKLLKKDEDVELSVIIVNDNEIRSFNEKYRGIDKPTDVLSFASIDKISKQEKEFYEENKLAFPLGDIIINYNMALKQANDYNHSVDREMCFLFVHGLLHLLGYDHQKKEDEEVMFSLQEKILSDLKIIK